MTVRTHSLINTDEADLADEVIKLLFGLDTAKEAHSQAKRISDSAWRDKMRVAPCRPRRHCALRPAHIVCAARS